MKVKEFIEELNKYNLEAKIEVLIDNYPKEFRIMCGGSEGCSNKSCDFVYLEVIGYNTSEDV
jgi:hypothetical protein